MNFDFETCSLEELREHFHLVTEHMLTFINKSELGNAGQQILVFNRLFTEALSRLEFTNTSKSDIISKIRERIEIDKTSIDSIGAFAPEKATDEGASTTQHTPAGEKYCTCDDAQITPDKGGCSKCHKALHPEVKKALQGSS